MVAAFFSFGPANEDRGARTKIAAMPGIVGTALSKTSGNQRILPFIAEALEHSGHLAAHL
jgi:hypothetical protein